MDQDQGSSGVGNDPDGLNKEQRAELNEAVEAEVNARMAPVKYEKIMTHLTQVPQMLYDLLGREQFGAPAYCRNKAIEKLEECIHRIGDGMAALSHRAQLEQEALAKAQAEGKVIQVGDFAAAGKALADGKGK